MPQPLSGPGIGLPLPQYLYPTELFAAPYDFSNNRLALAPGDAVPLPAGDWYVGGGSYCVAQYQDPVNGTWAFTSTAGWSAGPRFIKSDGFNTRIANLTGCPVGAEVTGGGTNYVQSSTTVTASAGNSTWAPIVGGALSVSTISNAGTGYGVAPLVLIPAPAGPSSNPNGIGGIAASAYATIANGTVSAVSFTNQGAGYPTAPTATILPNPTDPNINSGITAATVVLATTGAGAITGVLCTNNGAPLASISTFSLTAAGAGTGATLSAIVMQTVTAASVTAGGAGFGAANALLTTLGGVPTSSTTNTTPAKLNLAWRPRPAQIGLAQTAGALTSVAAIYDGGLFLGTPTPIVVSGLSAPTTAATVTLTMGSTPDLIVLQPAP